MRNFMEAYTAVHSREVKEELSSGKDHISEMNLSVLTDTDLDEIVESVLEEMFQKGYSVDSAHAIFSEMFVESSIAGRQAKIDRLCESLNKAFDVINSKASTIAFEEFAKYRHNKKLQESWSARFNQEKRVQRTHNQLVAQESLNVKTLLLKLVEKADKSYLETDMKKRQKNNEKARKEMEKMGTSMKNPHFEEVSKIRKDWGEAYTGIYEKMDPVGQEDGDIDNDGDEDSSDEYLMKRRKAIGKAMGKKPKCEACGDKGCEKCKDMKEGYKEIDQAKKNRMFRRAGNLSRDAISTPIPPEKRQDAHKKSGKIIKQLNKLNNEEFEDSFDQMFDSLIEEGYTKSEALEIMTQMALDEDSRRTSNKQQTARVKANIKSFGSNYTPPSNYDPDANRGKGEVVTRKQIEKKRRKALRQEEFELES